MKKSLSILVYSVWVFLLTSNLSGQSVKTEQEVRLENYMNTGKYISIAPSNMLSKSVRLILPHLIPSDRSVMYVSNVDGYQAVLSWQPADSIAGFNRLLDCSNYYLGTSVATAVSFYTNNQLRITITEDGRVGVGTANPSGALDINSNMPTVISAPTGEIPDAALDNGQISFYTVDSTNYIYSKAKKSDGTVVVQSRTAQILRTVVNADLPQLGNTILTNKYYLVVNVDGAAPGDGVTVSPAATMGTSMIIAYAFVSAIDTVTVSFKNGDSQTASPQANNPPMDFIITVIK